jgi:hypothetical protein
VLVSNWQIILFTNIFALPVKINWKEDLKTYQMAHAGLCIF